MQKSPSCQTSLHMTWLLVLPDTRIRPRFCINESWSFSIGVGGIGLQIRAFAPAKQYRCGATITRITTCICRVWIQSRLDSIFDILINTDLNELCPRDATLYVEQLQRKPPLPSPTLGSSVITKMPRTLLHPSQRDTDTMLLVCLGNPERGCLDLLWPALSRANVRILPELFNIHKLTPRLTLTYLCCLLLLPSNLLVS
jgi:hypothetical protein